VTKYQFMLIEEMCYEITNISVSKNNFKFKPTFHDYRLFFFKDMTTVEPVDYSIVILYVFKFTSYDKNFKAKN